MNFCKDCRFIVVKPESQTLDFARCAHPSNSLERPLYVVDGVGEPTERLYCTTARISPCGKDGSLFEPKEPVTA